MTVIHLGRWLLNGSSDLPGDWVAGMATGSRLPANWGGPPPYRLPIWSCTAGSLPSRACHHARWWALTLSALPA